MHQHENVFLHFVVAIFLGIFTSFADAHTDSDRILPLNLSNEKLVVLPYQTFQEASDSNERQTLRINKVLSHFQVPTVFPHEESVDSIFSQITNPKSRQDIQNQLKFLDPQSLLQRFIEIRSNLIRFNYPSLTNPTFAWSQQLPNQSSPPRPFSSLVGLKIGLDPGHMGGSRWDRLTGKFVRDQNGRELSEGLLNLQFALLLKQRLERRGAVVRLTTSQLQPATTLDYSTFDLAPFARFELRESTTEPWFLNLINQNTTDTEMIRRFERASQVRYFFSEAARRDYFIKRADLWARSKILNDFNADIALVIHFDATSSDSYESTEPNPQAPNETKAFVFGSYEIGEANSLQSLSYLAKRSISNDDYTNSKLVSRALVKRLSANLGLKLDTSSPINGQLIEPGIRSRNLVVSRYLKSSAVSYLETLFYNRPAEFNALLRRDHALNINGVQYPYSERLKKVVDATELGLIDFVEAR